MLKEERFLFFLIGFIASTLAYAFAGVIVILIHTDRMETQQVQQYYTQQEYNRAVASLQISRIRLNEDKIGVYGWLAEQKYRKSVKLYQWLLAYQEALERRK